MEGTPYATFSWLGQAASGWDDYDDPSKYNIKQAEQIYYNGKLFDDCIAVNDNYGQWYK